MWKSVWCYMCERVWWSASGQGFHSDDTEKRPHSSCLKKSRSNMAVAKKKRPKNNPPLIMWLNRVAGALVPSDRPLDQRDGDESSALTAKHHTAVARQGCWCCSCYWCCGVVLGDTVAHKTLPHLTRRVRRRAATLASSVSTAVRNNSNNHANNWRRFDAPGLCIGEKISTGALAHASLTPRVSIMHRARLSFHCYF